MKVRNALYAQSGGVTSVINATACAVIESSRKSKKIGKVFAGKNGIVGILQEDLIDTSIEDIKEINKLSNLAIEGVMMIPPFLDINDEYRSFFNKTKKIQLAIFKSGITSCINLSMGMSMDYEKAIKCGATHIRIGTQIFGPRN